MHIITKRRLKEFWQIHPDAQSSLMLWYTRTKHANWQSFVDLRSTFPSADLVGRFTVFDIKGGSYRLICRVEYELQKVFIRYVLTHEEYDREKWKNDEWF